MLLSASCDAVFTSSKVANLFPFNVFSLSGIKRNQRGLGPVNRVGGERRSIPERPNNGSQTKLCDLGRCHDGETNHPISTFLGVFFAHSLLIASKTSSKIPDWQSVQEGRIPGARFLEQRKKKVASFWSLTSLLLLFWSWWSGRFPLARSLFVTCSFSHLNSLVFFFRSRWSGRLPLPRSLFDTSSFSNLTSFVLHFQSLWSARLPLARSLFVTSSKSELEISSHELRRQWIVK